MILIGYDPQRVHVVDAFTGRTQSYHLKAFLASWKTLGKMAVLGGGLIDEGRNSHPEPSLLVELPLHTYLPLALKAPVSVRVISASVDIPQAYTVKRGDYLTDIARRFGLSWQQLASLNGISYPYVIRTGQILRLR
jgi:LysM repeat protein